MKALIYFLKEFPDKWILFILCLLTGIMYVYIKNDFISQLLNSVVSALIGLLIGISKNQTTIDTDLIRTDSITNDQMNDTTINVREGQEKKIN